MFIYPRIERDNSNKQKYEKQQQEREERRENRKTYCMGVEGGDEGRSCTDAGFIRQGKFVCLGSAAGLHSMSPFIAARSSVCLHVCDVSPLGIMRAETVIVS